MNRAPFYPCQSSDGSTYVVDGRNSNIVRTISSSFDTTARWVEAKRVAAHMNRAFVLRRYARRRRLVGWAFALALVALAFWGLTTPIREAINAAQ